MTLSRKSIETLIDLVEIKLSYMNITDKEDAKIQTELERCRKELQSMISHPSHKSDSIVRMPELKKMKK